MFYEGKSRAQARSSDAAHLPSTWDFARNVWSACGFSAALDRAWPRPPRRVGDWRSGFLSQAAAFNPGLSGWIRVAFAFAPLRRDMPGGVNARTQRDQAAKGKSKESER